MVRDIKLAHDEVGVAAKRGGGGRKVERRPREDAATM